MNASDAPPRAAGAATERPEVDPERPSTPRAVPVRSRPLRALYAGLGLICVGLGGIGVVLPGWPTTVWLLVAAFFFARSSPRFYGWLMRHRIFGPLLRDVREGRGIPLRTKVLALSMITLFAGTSGVLLWARPWISLIVWAVASIGIVVVLRQPTRRPDPT